MKKQREKRGYSPFDLAAALAGAPLRTRDGRPARIICTDCRDKDYPIVALITDDEGVESPCTYTAGGHIYADGHPAGGDLVMPPGRRTWWVNVYSCGPLRWTGRINGTEEEARREIDGNRETRVATVRIEWDE